MSAQQAMLTTSTSYHSISAADTGGNGYYYDPLGCSTHIYGYISGSQGSIITGATFRGLSITEYAHYQNWTEQNDSQNTDPYEWYCAPVNEYTILRISGATDQFFFKRIFFHQANVIYELKPENASFSSGTWQWDGGNYVFTQFYMEY